MRSMNTSRLAGTVIDSSPRSSWYRS
jgi:hypothetical protein